MKEVKKAVPDTRKKGIGCLKAAILFLLIILFILFWFNLLETGDGFKSFGKMRKSFSKELLLLNAAAISAAFSVVFAVIGKAWISTLFMTVITALVALINHYTIILHGMPVTFQELGSIGAAWDVMRGSVITIDPKAKLLIIAGLAGIAVAVFIIRPLEKGSSKKAHIAARIVFPLVALFCFWTAFFSPKALKPKYTFKWSWESAYHTYGFAASSVESFFNLFNLYVEPDGYSPEAVKAIAEKVMEEPDASVSDPVRPDVFLILNESFYDLSLVTDLNTDTELMPRISHMDNLYAGYAVVPNTGGGTNASEYEMLTSNTLETINAPAPFNLIDMSDSFSAASLFKEMGYVTTAAHIATGTNYSRQKAYPAMGFDNVHFIEDFTDLEFYGARKRETDQSCYRNLLRWYEETGHDAPQFFYCLTIQNHLSYNINEPELDTIRAQTDYGDHDAEVDEYLTCVNLSDEAFYELTEYLSGTGRPAVVVMVGDHCPSFAGDIADPSLPEDEKRLLLRETPLLIWANYDLPEANNTKADSDSRGLFSDEKRSINFLLPFVFQKCGLSGCGYYSFINKLTETWPVVSSYGGCVDSSGNQYSFADVPQEVKDYLYLEYNNLNGGRERVDELFVSSSRSALQ